MNRMKFRPVGQPSGPITEVRIQQCRRALTPQKPGRSPRGISRAAWIRYMNRKGFVPAGSHQ